MIDFNEYKTYFDTYAARYDKADGRVALKIVHTYAVVSVMETLCRLRCLPPIPPDWPFYAPCSMTSAGLSS